MKSAMKSTTIEPGMLRVLQIWAVSVLVLLPVVRRGFTTSMGIAAPLEQYLLVMMPGAILLNAFVWLPWPRRSLGRAFLPVTITLFATIALIEKHFSITWLMAAPMRDLAVLLMTLRVWLTFQVIVLIVAWHYSIAQVVAISLFLAVVDGLLGIAMISIHSPLFPIFVLIIFMRLCTLTTIGVVVGWLLAREREQRRALADANRKLALAATTAEQLAISQERNRMARELHDTLAHSLSGVTVQLEAVDALWEVDPTQSRTMVNRALHSTRTGLTEARRALHALRASPLEDLGLGLAISNLANDVATRTDLKLELSVPVRLEDIPPDVEQCVYRIAQEALTNVARHARAQSVRVIMQQTPEMLTLMVADDGCGFDVNGNEGNLDPQSSPRGITAHTAAQTSTHSSAHLNAHFGLKGLRERAQMVGGHLSVTSARGEGTTLQFAIAV